MNEGELSGVLGLHGLAGGRGGGDHRPRRAARRARRLAAARLPRVDRRLGRDPALGQEQGLERHRRGHPAPPAAHRRARHVVRPGLQGQPAAAHRRRRGRAARGARRRHHRRGGDRPRAALARGQGLRVGRGRDGDARPRDRAVGGAGGDGRDRPARLGRGRRPDVDPAGRGSAGSTTTAGRSRWAHRPTSCWSTRRPGARSTRSRWPRGPATRRTPGAPCPARWSPPSSAAARPSSTGSSSSGRRHCWSSRTAARSAASPTARPARPSARPSSRPG